MQRPLKFFVSFFYTKTYFLSYFRVSKPIVVPCLQRLRANPVYTLIIQLACSCSQAHDFCLRSASPPYLSLYEYVVRHMYFFTSHPHRRISNYDSSVKSSSPTAFLHYNSYHPNTNTSSFLHFFQGIWWDRSLHAY